MSNNRFTRRIHYGSASTSFRKNGSTSNHIPAAAEARTTMFGQPQTINLTSFQRLRRIFCSQNIVSYVKSSALALDHMNAEELSNAFW